MTKDIRKKSQESTIDLLKATGVIGDRRDALKFATKEEAEAFVSELQRQYPHLPAGKVLRVQTDKDDKDISEEEV